MLSTEAVANYFIKKSFENDTLLTPMQLIKLVYIAHGWHLGYLDKPLIGEPIQAWQYGPVIDSLYRKVRNYGRGVIPGFVGNSEFIGDDRNRPDDPLTTQLLDHVWEGYGKKDGIELSALTHQSDTPWAKTFQGHDGSGFYYNPVIPDELIRAHYKSKING